MAENSKISWCDHTSNFWWGCMKVSPGCQHCYAETLSKRYGKQIWGPAATTEREYKKAVWREIVKWNVQAAAEGVRRRVFVQSMADFFEDHPQVVEWRHDALALMLASKYLDFQILTKRPENILPMLEAAGESLLRHGGHNAVGVQLLRWLKHGIDYAPANVWIGTSVENQEQADKRIPNLLKVPAAVKFLSCEPLLGRVDLVTGGYLSHGWTGAALPGVSWIIAGAESGHGARPMDLNWVRFLRDQCAFANVPFFFKQQIVNGRKVELPELDGQVWAQFPQSEVAA
jgi:protein gp37